MALPTQPTSSCPNLAPRGRAFKTYQPTWLPDMQRLHGVNYNRASDSGLTRRGQRH